MRILELLEGILVLIRDLSSDEIVERVGIMVEGGESKLKKRREFYRQKLRTGQCA